VKGFLPASYIGAGVMLIKRTMVTEMLEKMPHLIDALPGVLAKATPLPLTRLLRTFNCILREDCQLSEDVSFCERWRQCGGEIWANVNHKISHVGPFDFHMRYGGVLEAKAAAKKRQGRGRMTTYTETEFATETLRAPGLLGMEETLAAAEYDDVTRSNRSVVGILAAIGLPIWNGSEISVPEEYFVELAMRCSLPLQFKYGLVTHAEMLR
jgi:hypothetical protein